MNGKPATDEARGDAGSRFAALLAAWKEGGPGRVPIVMGVLNVTPDSFSDGGMFGDPEAAAAHGERLLLEGAAMLDVGGESTRKDAEPVPATEERKRVLPVIEALRRRSEPLISIDTMKASVAAAALGAGAAVINDVRGLLGDPDMAALAGRSRAGVIAMHNPGILGSAAPLQGDPIAVIRDYFERVLETARRGGIPDDRIVLDPGFGFGKSPEQNLEVLARLPELAALGFPILVGTSRKSFIGKVTGRDAPDRLFGTLATNVAAALGGATIVRVHDVAAHVDAMNMAAAIKGAGHAWPPRPPEAA